MAAHRSVILQQLTHNSRNTIVASRYECATHARTCVNALRTVSVTAPTRYLYRRFASSTASSSSQPSTTIHASSSSASLPQQPHSSIHTSAHNQLRGSESILHPSSTPANSSPSATAASTSLPSEPSVMFRPFPHSASDTATSTHIVPEPAKASAIDESQFAPILSRRTSLIANAVNQATHGTSTSTQTQFPPSPYIDDEIRADYERISREYARANFTEVARANQLKSPFDLFVEPQDVPSDLQNEDLAQLLQQEGVPPSVFMEQIRSEGMAIQATVREYKAQAEELVRMQKGPTLAPAQKMLLAWYGPLVQALTQLLNENNQYEKGGVGAYLVNLSPPELAVITMHTLFGLLLHEPQGVKFISACMAIGKAVDMEVKLATIRSSRTEWKGLVASMSSSGSKAEGQAAVVSDKGVVVQQSQSGAATMASLASQAASSSTLHLTAGSLPEIVRRAKKIKNETWSNEVLVKVGSTLMATLLKTAAMPQELLSTPAPSVPNSTAETATKNIEGAAAAAAAAATMAANATEGAFLNSIKEGPTAAATAAASESGQKKKKQMTPRPLVPRFIPAFFHFYQRSGALNSTPTPEQMTHPRIIGYVRADLRVLNVVLKDAATLRTLLPKLSPMLVPPKNWTSFDEGGYLSVRHKIVRAHGSFLQTDAVRHADLKQVYDGVNFLAKTAWSIHSGVWGVVKELWNQGGGVADLPPRKDKPLPPAPSDRKNKEAWRLYESIKLYNSSLHSQRCDLQYKLLAAAENEGKKIYYPYFLDFRGRAYPIPPYLNHTGGDLSRGMLRFWQGKPLGERGLYWLLVHIATLYGGGVDKQSFAVRQKWSENHINELRESAENPLKGSRWWLSAEKPFQFLAAAMELVAALRSPSPKDFLSTLPVHTDGSCNGLQHYAALGRDLWGGSCVNLTASDKPQDVYSRVLDTVHTKLAADAADPTNPRCTTARKLLQVKLSRKIVKQTVMTSVYGVTMIGARDQILARLQERDDIVKAFSIGGMDGANTGEGVAIGRDDLRSVAMYIAQLTLSSLFDAFAGARRIQDWLGDCALRMAGVQQPVSWISPLGLPIIQPYRRNAMYTVQTAMQSVSLVDHSDLLPVSSVRQKSAFPPNFIHSLDASHMLLTALASQERGITFASVHDSYWTHAGSMDDLSAALREQFVHLYQQPILEMTRDSWVQRFPEISFGPVPQRGELDIKAVLTSPYFFN